MSEDPVVVIRTARADDAATLARLIDQLGYQVSAAEVAARLPLLWPGEHALVAELGERVVGCLTTSTIRVLHRPAPVGRIAMMVIEAEMRGRRIGERLVREAERLLAENGCYMVEVTSQLQRVDAHRFYERLGYEKTSVRLARTLKAAGPIRGVRPLPPQRTAMGSAVRAPRRGLS